MLHKENQWRLKLKSKVLEKEAKYNLTKTLPPHKCTILQRNQSLGFERLKMKTLTAYQRCSFHHQVPNDDSEKKLGNYHCPYFISSQEIESLQNKADSLTATIEDDFEAANTIIPSQVANRDSQKNKA